MLITVHWALEAIKRLEVVMESHAADSECPEERTPAQWVEAMKEVLDTMREGKCYAGPCIQGGEIYWIKFSHRGENYYASSKSTKKEDATRLLSMYLGEIAAGTFRGLKKAVPSFCSQSYWTTSKRIAPIGSSVESTELSRTSNLFGLF
jgi:hypothetical protein